MDRHKLWDGIRTSREAFTLIELLMTVGIVAALLAIVGNLIHRDMSHRQLSAALAIVENILSLAVVTARLDHLYVRIFWHITDGASEHDQQFFLLTSPQMSPSAEWTWVRSGTLPEHCQLLTQIDSKILPSGDVVNVSKDWLTGASETLNAGSISVREWFFNPSGELRDANGNTPPYRAIGVGYGKNNSLLGCVLVNANGNVQTYEGIDAVQTVLASL